MADNKQNTQAEANKEQIDVKALLEAQTKEFEEKMKAQAEANKEQIEALVARNNELATELSNLKANTAEENELLGEKIKAIKNGKAELPDYNPFQERILYNVTNEVAKITTTMTGDEVQGIIGSIDEHLQKKLIKGAKKIEKHPYIIELIEVAKAEKV